MGRLIHHSVIALLALILALALLPAAPAFAALPPTHPLPLTPYLGTTLHALHAVIVALAPPAGPPSLARHITVDGRVLPHCPVGCSIARHPFPPPLLAHGLLTRPQPAAVP